MWADEPSRLQFRPFGTLQNLHVSSSFKAVLLCCKTWTDCSISSMPSCFMLIPESCRRFPFQALTLWRLRVSQSRPGRQGSCPASLPPQRSGSTSSRSLLQRGQSSKLTLLLVSLQLFMWSPLAWDLFSRNLLWTSCRTSSAVKGGGRYSPYHLEAIASMGT